MRVHINTQARFTISAFSRARDDSRWKDYYDDAIAVECARNARIAVNALDLPRHVTSPISS